MSTTWKKFALSTTAFSLLAGNAFATDYIVSQGTDTSVLTGGAGSGISGELRYVLNQLLNDRAQNLGGTTHTITFSVPSVTLTNTLPMINLFTSDTITIGNLSGPTATIDGGSAGRPFYIAKGTVTLQNLDIQSGKAQGGSGGKDFGGGGMGAGGALFIDNATVTLSNVSFSNNTASAGLGDTMGGTGIGGGGGGLGGSGGDEGGGGGGYSGHGGNSFGGGGGAGKGGNGNIFAGGGGGGAIIGADGGGFDTNGGDVPPYVFGGGGGGGYIGGAAGKGGGTPPATGGGSAGGGGGGGYNGASGSSGSGGSGGAGGLGGINGGGGGGGGFDLLGGNVGGDGGLGGGGGSYSFGGSSGGSAGYGGGGGGGASGQDGGFGGGGGGSIGGGPGSGGGVGASNGEGGTSGPGGDGAGLGGAIFLNTGTLILQGNSTTSSNTTSSNLGTGANAGGDLFLRTGAILTFDTAQTVNFSGSIADDSLQSLPGGTYNPGSASGASLTKQGSGLLILGGNNTYAGPTSVTGGRLSVNGTLRSTVTVSSGATLGGTGTLLNPVTIQSGGFLTPGNSIGPIAIGTLTLNSGSTTQIELDPTTSSEIIITTGATIDGTLQVLTDPGTYSIGQIYDILTGPYTGTFSSLTAPNGFTFSTIYSTDLIQLLLQSIFVPPQMINTQGLSGNNKKVANYLNKHAPNSAAFADLASLSGDTLKKALESVSPSRNALPIFAAQNLYFSLSEVVSSHLSQHRFLKDLSGKNETLAMQLFEEDMGDSIGYLADASENPQLTSWCPAPEKMKTARQNPCDFCPEKPYAFWVGAFAENLHQNSHHQTPGFNSLSEAVFAAFDYYAQRGVAGATTGYAHTQLWDQHHMGKANVNYYYSSVYGTAQNAPFYMDFAAWGGYLDIHSERNISFPGFHKTAKAHYHAWQFSPHLELGGDIDKSWGGFEPFVAFDYVNTWQVGFKEHGADSMNMKQKNHHSSMLRSSAGLRIYENWTWNSGTLLLKQQVAYVNRKIFRTGQVNAAIVGGTGSFFVEALMPTQNLGAAAFEALFAPSNPRSAQFSLGYFGEFGAGTQLNQIILKIIKEF